MKSISFLFLLAGSVASCATWQTTAVGGPASNGDRVFAGEYALRDDGRDVRLRLDDGRVAYYRTAALHGDTLYGFVGTDSVAYARQRVQAVDVRRVSRKRTVALGVIGTLAAVGGVALIIDCCTTSTRYMAPAIR